MMPSLLEVIMKKPDTIVLAILGNATIPTEPQEKSSSEPAYECRDISIEEWLERAVARLNDQMTPFPRVW
jgi:hypothetical protein